MTGLRRPLLAVVAMFSAAITIDRLGVDHGSDAIGSHVYFLAALAVAAPLAMGGLRRSRPWLPAVLAIGAYTGGLAVSSRGLASIHVTLTEVAFLVTAALLGHHIAGVIHDIGETLGAIAFGASKAIDIESLDAANEIHAEIARSRRHDRPLSLTILHPTQDGMAAAMVGAGQGVDGAIRSRFVYGKLTRAVSDQLRRSDLLFEHRLSGRLFVLSPETDTAGNTLLVERIVTAATDAGVPVAAGAASFPSDAIGFDGLIEVAEEALDADLQPAPVLRAVEQGASP